MPSEPGISRIPKAELHVHIEGTLEPEMVFDLAARNQVPLAYDSVDELRARYRFTDLQSFLDIYYANMAVLRTERDFADLASAYLTRAAAQGVRHAEIFFDPQAHTRRGVPIATVINGLSAAVRDAAPETSAELILCFLRDESAESAMETLRAAEPHLDQIIGVGLDSAEVGYPPAGFTEVFRQAAKLGLRTVAHAGEEGPPEYVRQALDELGVHRIDHGIRALEDAELVRRLRIEQIPLTVCPLSNVRLGGFPDLAAHTLPRLLDEGLLVTINSDDPAYFGGYVGDNFAAIHEQLAIPEARLYELATNSIRASFLPHERQRRLLDEITEYAAKP
ncbi:adenosine deaminase [Tamaricihabitans halophyticus]|uniref:Adenine deaminase n=1 Tax=Tamaricihabitans halophyticus TaxID=1262583 RepID=A0A4R2QER5_9PSEU|nr:adenosine deaminase [Tamaricihabitans halophyticus]TCP46778.1 adenosine deaminase [Tamaricihabitans halophyticus]